MRSTHPTAVFVVATLAVLAGCAGAAPPTAGSAGPTERPSTGPTTPAVSPPVSNETAGERAIAAEKACVRAATADWESLTGLSFGILRPADYEVRAANASGVLVDVTVGYSASFDCGLSADGMVTETQYLVTADETRLVSVATDVGQSPGRTC